MGAHPTPCMCLECGRKLHSITRGTIHLRIAHSIPITIAKEHLRLFERVIVC